MRSGKAYGADKISILIGNIELQHGGYVLYSDSAVFNQSKNQARFYQKAQLNAGDTIRLFSDAMFYDGNTEFAEATGRVRLVDEDMTLTTDTLYFDGKKNIAYYRSGGKIVDRKDTLTMTSQRATYDISTKAIRFQSAVHIDHPEYAIESEQLTYHRDTELMSFDRPSTVVNKSDGTKTYTEKGDYNAHTRITHLTKNPVIHYKNQDLKGDTIFYDGERGFGSATGHIEMRAPREKTLIRGGYGEYFQFQDSAFVVQQPVAIRAFLKGDGPADSLYIHGDTILATRQGAGGDRVLRIFSDVKFFKSDLQGSCDHMRYDESNGVMKMLGNPIAWSGKNQMTADTMLLATLPKEEKLDSLILIGNAFINSKLYPLDPSDRAFNQVKGHRIYGKFIGSELRRVLVSENAESIYYVDDDKKIDSTTGKPARIGINKMKCARIFMTLKEERLENISCQEQPDAVLYPEGDLPEGSRVLSGFSWRESERPKSKEAIFSNNRPSEPTNPLKPIAPTKQLHTLNEPSRSKQLTQPNHANHPNQATNHPYLATQSNSASAKRNSSSKQSRNPAKNAGTHPRKTSLPTRTSGQGQKGKSPVPDDQKRAKSRKQASQPSRTAVSPIEPPEHKDSRRS